MQSSSNFWTINNPLIAGLLGVLLLATGPIGGVLFFTSGWDGLDAIPDSGWQSDIAAMLVQAYVYYSMAAVVIGPGLILYGFIRLVVIMVKRIKNNFQ
jgi:hypothetical protein